MQSIRIGWTHVLCNVYCIMCLLCIKRTETINNEDVKDRKKYAKSLNYKFVTKITIKLQPITSYSQEVSCS